MEDIINITRKLQDFWNNNKFNMINSWDVPMGAGTFHPVFLTNIHKEECNFHGYQVCRRPFDIDKINSNQRHPIFYQYQVIVKPVKHNIKQIFLDSIKYIGIDINKCYIEFIDSKWSSEICSAYGLGYEVRINGLEICQITHFDMMYGCKLDQPVTEIAYGINRLANILNIKDNIFNYFDHYSKEYRLLNCNQNIYTTEDIDYLLNIANKLIDNNLPHLCYDQILQAINVFNVMDISNTFEYQIRKKYIINISKLINKCYQSIKLNT